MNKLELEYRRYIISELAQMWYPTIHVESHLCPGVPDLSYVLLGGKNETGWLELKAVDDPKDVFVERSQHVWIQKHADLVPVHFLIKVKNRAFLISGRDHGNLDRPTEERLQNLSLLDFPSKEVKRDLAPALFKLTLR